MNFKTGDLVRFVDEAIEGHITSIKGDIVGVTDKTGFEIPVPASKVTLVHGNNMRRDDDEPQGKKNEADPEDVPFAERGIYVAVEGEQAQGLAKFYLLNRTSYDLLASVSEVSGNKYRGVFAGKIAKKGFAAFYSANFSQVGKWPEFRIQALRHSERPMASAAVPIDREFRVKPAALTLAKEHDGLLDAEAWLFQLDKTEENIGLEKLKEHFVSHRPPQSRFKIVSPAPAVSDK